MSWKVFIFILENRPMKSLSSSGLGEIYISLTF